MEFFIPGIHPTLSKAELQALDPNLSLKIIQDVFLGTLKRPFEEVVHKTGGLIKAGKVFLSLEHWDEATIAETLASMCELPEGVSRLIFGISAYGETTSETLNEIHRIGMHIKRTLGDRGISSRSVTSKEHALSSVIVSTNHLVQRGMEFVLIFDGKSLHVGQTLWVQDFSAWSKRDFGRPSRNAKSGMLPPKLARIMLNLTGIEPATATLWDPFCGSGTVLMEGIGLGFKAMYGSDISERAIKETEKNLRWFKEETSQQGTVITFVHDATKTLPEDQSISFNVIVGEGDLGHPQKGRESIEQLEQEQIRLASFYEHVLKTCAKYLAKKGIMVIAVPRFSKSPIPELSLKIPSSLKLVHPRNTLTYARAGQYVGREILILKRS